MVSREKSIGGSSSKKSQSKNNKLDLENMKTLNGPLNL